MPMAFWFAKAAIPGWRSMPRVTRKSKNVSSELGGVVTAVEAIEDEMGQVEQGAGSLLEQAETLLAEIEDARQKLAA
jgi:uncharacterized phage infection (PIP) family protein YhgE